MTSEDMNVFREAYKLYAKWFGVAIGSLKQWETLTEDLRQLTAKYEGNRLAVHLAAALEEVFEDFHKNGYQPTIQEYLGRSDL